MEESRARDRIAQMIAFVEQEAKEKAKEIESKTEEEYNKEKSKHL
jgi:vacuolar-type H+-ATPase subunit E/Vma4